jgi:hypothetical protein
MLAMRAYMRSKTVDCGIAERVGLSGNDIEEMCRPMAIANHEDRFVIPTAHRETGEDAYQLRGSCAFSFGDGCSGRTGFNLPCTNGKGKDTDGGRVMARTYRALAALLAYPTPEPQSLASEIAAALEADGLLTDLAARDIYDLQERYVALFNRGARHRFICSNPCMAKAATAARAMADLPALYGWHGLG